MYCPLLTIPFIFVLDSDFVIFSMYFTEWNKDIIIIIIIIAAEGSTLFLTMCPCAHLVPRPLCAPMYSQRDLDICENFKFIYLFIWMFSFMTFCDVV